MLSKMFSDMFLIYWHNNNINSTSTFGSSLYLWHWVATQGAPGFPCYLSLLFGIQGRAAELK